MTFSYTFYFFVIIVSHYTVGHKKSQPIFLCNFVKMNGF